MLQITFHLFLAGRRRLGICAAPGLHRIRDCETGRQLRRGIDRAGGDIALTAQTEFIGGENARAKRQAPAAQETEEARGEVLAQGVGMRARRDPSGRSHADPQR